MERFPDLSARRFRSQKSLKVSRNATIPAMASSIRAGPALYQELPGIAEFLPAIKSTKNMPEVFDVSMSRNFSQGRNIDV